MGFRPKKITPFRVRVIGGRFEGATGNVVDQYDDGVFGIDLDEPKHDSPRGFAKEGEIERVDGAHPL